MQSLKHLTLILKQFLTTPEAQERHTKGHALALIKRLEEITYNYNHHD